MESSTEKQIYNEIDEIIEFDQGAAHIAQNRDKENRFVELLENIRSFESTWDLINDFSEKFLEIMGGQSLIIFYSDRPEEEYLPRFILGENRDILNSCFYHKNDKMTKRITETAGPVQFQKDTGFEKDLVLNELSKTLDFHTAIASPLKTDSSKVGMTLLLGEKDRETYRERDIKLFRAFTAIIGLMSRHSTVMERLEKQTREMDRKDFDLYIVYQVAKALSSMLDLDELTSMMADLLTEVLTVSHSMVFLTDENEEKLTIKAYKYLNPKKSCNYETLEVSDKLPEWLLSHTFEGEILTDFSEENFLLAFPGAHEILDRMEIIALVPMIYKFKLVGFLALGKKYIGDQFLKRDCDFLSTIAPLMANAISNAKLYELAILDGLTKVYVGRYFQQRCKEEIKRARRYKNVLSLVMWDLDKFKDINDTYGHLAGDRVLKELAVLFKKGYRQDVDLIARLGGEEFIMLLPDTPAPGAFIMAERLRRTIEEFPFCDGNLSVTISGGISSFPEDGEDYLSLVEKADMRLYRAKNAGRNLVCWKNSDQNTECSI